MSVVAFPVVQPLPRRAAVSVRRRVQPRPAADITRMIRYRGGTYSHTVDTVTFMDGSRARTDLIRLNPGIEAYSLDFTGVAPTRPSRYRVETWRALPNLRAHAYEAEVDWILRNSYPTLRPAELSRRLRAAGHPLGTANIAEHEAIAGTQAAIWHLTNGLELDNRSLAAPTRVSDTADGMVFEFDGPRELGGCTVDLVTDAEVILTWQKSIDGHTWREIAGSRLAVGEGSHRKSFGVGTTVSTSRHARGAGGYPFYRLTVATPHGGTATVADVRFWLQGSGAYRNSERVVHLYNYLLDGARRARARVVAPALDSSDADVRGELVGPLRLHATESAALTVAAGSRALIVDADGAELAGPIAPGQPFYLRIGSGEGRATLTVTVPGTPDGHGGRVLTGVALDESSQRYTPLALAVPAKLVVDFDVSVGSLRRTAGSIRREGAHPRP